MSFVLELARTNPKRRKEFADAGIVSTLKRICEWPAGVSVGGGTGPGGPGLGPGARRMSMGHHHHHDEDVIVQARAALDWLELGSAIEGGF